MTLTREQVADAAAILAAVLASAGSPAWLVALAPKVVSVFFELLARRLAGQPLDTVLRCELLDDTAVVSALVERDSRLVVTPGHVDSPYPHGTHRRTGGRVAAARD